MKMIYGVLIRGKENEKWRGKLEIKILSPSKLSPGPNRKKKKGKEREKEKHRDCCFLLMAAP
jgi:hypothetical protein